MNLETSEQNLWKGKKVLITGHTGFKGSWLAIWLKELGAEVLGVALEPLDPSTNFCVTKLDSEVKTVYLDLRNFSALKVLFSQFQPDVVFHLAAQALVGISYEKPRDTFETNVIGTLNILEAIKTTSSVKAGVIITSDKCYQNIEQVWGYREHDRLGGDDPYSASKAAAEMIIKGYQKSFFEKGSPRIASVRAGNVIGGGDWSAYRLVPDCFKALLSNKPIIIRNPNATRPWQFVLEPLRGYILTAEKLLEQKPLSRNFNFGPSLEKAYSVSEVAHEIVKQWGSGELIIENQNLFHECSLLQLDCTQAKMELGWAPALKFEEHIKFTSDWYKELNSGNADMYAFCAKQINEYSHLAQERGQIIPSETTDHNEKEYEVKTTMSNESTSKSVSNSELNSEIRIVDQCRICNSPRLKLILDYGDVALADSFIRNKEAISTERKFPLSLYLCQDCKHIQIREIVHPSLLFEDYPWETGVSKSIVQFSQELYQKLMEVNNSLPLNQTPRVLEVASNDGAILSVFKEKGCEILGVDPAKNIVEKANAKGIRSIAKYFNDKTAKEVVDEFGKWDICIARNVIAHVDNLPGLAEGIKLILKESGFAVIECPHALKMLDELQYDQVFHEHIGFHSLDSIKKLFELHEMEVFDAEKIWIHGGSIRVFVQHTHGLHKITSAVDTLIEEERAKGMFDESIWEEFARKSLAHKNALITELQKMKDQGKKIAIYGASGKGQSLLQFCGIDSRYIDYVVDKSKMKQGRFTPGTHLEIFSPDHIYEDRPDVLLLCAWNFADEIIKQEERFSILGGKFLHPFPLPHYLN